MVDRNGSMIRQYQDSENVADGAQVGAGRMTQTLGRPAAIGSQGAGGDELKSK